MATSGTYTFDPRVAECLDEAWERATGRHPREMELGHIVSAKRSLNLLLRSKLSGEGILLWTVREETQTPAQSENSFAFTSAGVLDVLEATSKDSSNNETRMEPISREEYRNIPDKTIEGRPDRFWVDQSGLGAPTFRFYQAQGATPYTIVMNVLYGIQDAGDLHNTLEVTELWFDAVCAGLAARLAEKWTPEREAGLIVKFEKALRDAKEATSSRERAPIFITASYAGGAGRRF